MYYSINLDKKIKIAFLEEADGQIHTVTFDAFKFSSRPGEGLELSRILPPEEVESAEIRFDVICFIPIASIKKIHFVDLEKSTSEN
jgi:hypothetical protein